MKVVLLVLGFFVIGLDSDIAALRSEFHHIETHQELKDFIAKYNKHNTKESAAYVASATMRKAEFVFSPIFKLKYFNRGRKKLELYISENPKCVEGRYLRVLVQKEVPGFLGCKKNIKEDIEFIKRNIEKTAMSEDYKELIINNINTD